MEPHDGCLTAGAKEQEAEWVGGQQIESPAPEHEPALKQGQTVHQDAERGHERHEAEIVAEAAQRGRETPQARIAAAAVVAAIVIDANEIAARDTDDRTGRLTLEHPGENSTRPAAII